MPDLPIFIHNERVKYRAAALDRLSTACYVVGCLNTAAGLFTRQPIPTADGVQEAVVVGLICFVIFFAVGAFLNSWGKRILGELR